MKQVLPTYINHSRHIIPDVIHRHEGMRKESVFIFIFLAPNKGTTGTILCVFGMMRPGIEPALEADALPLGYLGCVHKLLLYLVCVLATIQLLHDPRVNIPWDAFSILYNRRGQLIKLRNIA